MPTTHALIYAMLAFVVLAFACTMVATQGSKMSNNPDSPVWDTIAGIGFGMLISAFGMFLLVGMLA